MVTLVNRNRVNQSSRTKVTPLYTFWWSIINSYTMAARDFADIYTQSLRATGPRAVGVYVSKIPSSRGISDITWGALT